MSRGNDMTQYEYLMKMKDIAEQAGHKHPDLMPFYSAAAETFENRAKDLPISVATSAITQDQSEYLANHIYMGN